MNRNLEGNFYEYLYRQGYADEEWVKEVATFYIPYFAQCQRVLDIGCGRGEFIELLLAHGISAAGIDVDQQMVEICQSKGLDVINADLFDYLPQQRGIFDGLFCSNLIEHLSSTDALRLVKLAFDALPERGVLLIATPNPESQIVHLYEFWRDPTHIRLYNRALLEFFMSLAGFGEVESGVNSRTRWTGPVEWQTAITLLEETKRPFAIWEAATNYTARSTERFLGHRFVFSLRRRLAQFLAQTVLFEEFSALNEVVDKLRQSDQLFHLLLGPLLAPREIFVKGVKPSRESKSAK